jgi:hypothetical protein
VLLSDDDLRAFKAKVYNSSLYTKSVAANKGLLDSLKTAIHSITLAPLNSDI